MKYETRIIKEAEGIFTALENKIEVLTGKCYELNRNGNLNINKLIKLAKPFKNSNMPLYFCINGIALACKLKQEEEESY